MMVKKSNTTLPRNVLRDDQLILSLEMLPVSAIIFTNEKILFANKLALKMFKATKNFNKTITKHSIFDFLLPEYHKRIRINNIKILRGEEFDRIVVKIKNAKNEIIHLDVKSNLISFQGKRAIQTVFINITKQTTEEILRIEAEEKFQSIVNHANDIVYFYSTGKNPKLTYVSPSIEKILGYSAQSFYKNKNLSNQIVVDKKAHKKVYQQLGQSRKNIALKYKSSAFQYKTKSGKLIWLEDNYSPIYDEKGNVKFILGISRDITTEKTYQLELEQKWNNYKNLLDNSPIGIFIHKGKCIYSNKTAASILEEKNPQKLIGKNLIKFLIPEQQQRAIDRMSRAIKGEELSDLQYKVRTVKGKIIDIELKTTPFIYNGEACVQTIISNISAEKQLSKEILRAEIAEETNVKLSKEINNRKKIEQALSTQKAKYEAVFESTSHLIWTIDQNFNFTSFNQNFIKSFKENFKTVPQLNKPYYSCIPKASQKFFKDYWYNKYSEALKGSSLKFERKTVNAKGEISFMEVSINPIKNRSNRITEIACLAHDITEQKGTEQKIIDSLQEKEILLKELHHRVKNNMQVISSLLNLQSTYVTDKYALTLLKESQNRIKAMAFIHESLYQTKNFQKIDFSEYISTLTKNLIHTYGISAEKIKLEMSLDRVFLNINESIPCGLIINELISNSLKYAFPNERDGIIFVNLKQINNKIKIEVGDNGIGIPKWIDIKNTKTLGLQLVNTLAEQIDARVSLKVNNGTMFYLEFNIYE